MLSDVFFYEFRTITSAQQRKIPQTFIHLTSLPYHTEWYVSGAAADWLIWKVSCQGPEHWFKVVTQPKCITHVWDCCSLKVYSRLPVMHARERVRRQAEKITHLNKNKIYTWIVHTAWGMRFVHSSHSCMGVCMYERVSEWSLHVSFTYAWHANLILGREGHTTMLLSIKITFDMTWQFNAPCETKYVSALLAQ